MAYGFLVDGNEFSNGYIAVKKAKMRKRKLLTLREARERNLREIHERTVR